MTDNIQEKVEDKIIDCINEGAAGRLIISKPDNNSMGIDLVVERRGKYKEKEFYFKVNSFVGPAKNKNLVMDFSQETFREEENFYLIFAYFDEISQKIADHLWLIPSTFFRDTADVIESPSGEKLLRFENNLDFKNKNAYSKFIINTKELGELILDALEAGGKISFKNSEFNEKRPVNLDNLKYFLCEARRNTYASNSAHVDNPSLSGSTQLEFQRGDYFYVDFYFSGEKIFIGSEIIYQESKPVWVMNYRGSQIGVLETNFLKESLLKLSEKCRLGESCEYKKRELRYQNTGKGGMEDFSGKEEILSGEKSIYTLTYQGGALLDKI